VHALTVSEPGAISLAERPEPEPRDGEVLVRPDLVGICGTDLDILAGDIDPQFVRYPLTIGHEWTGTVVSTRTSPGGPPPGTRVVVEGIVPCGHCAQCVAGNTNRCATYDEFGFTRDGAAGDLISAPTRLVHPVAPTVAAESAVLVEPASVVLRALIRSRPHPGQRVLVVGDGTIGLLAARLIRLWSPSTVTMLGLRPSQSGLAATAGVDDFRSGSLQAHERFDLVVDGAGSAASVQTALTAAERGGTVTLLGYVGQDAAVRMPVDDLINGDVTIVASFGYTSSVWRQVVDLLNAGTLDLGFLVTHRFALRDWASALDTVRASDGPRAKVTLMPGVATLPQ
jgi:2-desacetyl-2-hydroxyethyl bacteriochlorophyllide A dehydrogenase